MYTASESKENLPQAEVNESYFSDESNESGDITRVQVNVQYNDGGRCGSIQNVRKEIKVIVHKPAYQYAVIFFVLMDAAIVITTIMIDDSSNKDKKSHAIEIVEETLHYTSLSILSGFMLEITIKIFALGVSFFKNKLEVFDACIVIISFVLDVLLIGKGNESLLGGVEFIILLRLWRISRIVNGIIVSVKKKSEEKVQHLLLERDGLQEQLNQLELKLVADKKEIKFLRSKLESMGINVDEQPKVD